MDGLLLWLLSSLAKPGQLARVVNVKLPPAQDDGGIFGLPSWWGTAPAWAAVIVAIVVGSFTVRGIRGSLAGLALQREAYAENVWQTKVAVARQVYADVLDVKEVKPGESRPHFNPTPSVFFGTEFMDDEGVDGDGNSACSVTRQVNALHVFVRNNSKEPVGRARISLHYPEITDEPRPVEVYELGTLRPETDLYCAIYYPRDRSLYDTDPNGGPGFGMVRALLRLNFFDSAGVEWRREETYAPIVEFEPSVLRHVDDGFTGWT